MPPTPSGTFRGSGSSRARARDGRAAGRSWSPTRSPRSKARRPAPTHSRRPGLPSPGSSRTPLQPGAPPFAGGLVGHLGYDLGRRLEQLPVRAVDDRGLPDLLLRLHPWTIAWDGRNGHAWLAGRPVDGDGAGLERILAGVRARVEAAAARAVAESSTAPRPAVSSRRPVELPGRPGWRSVRAAIAAGELYQANLTRRLVAPFDGDPWAVFRRLRAGEPAAFTAYLDLGAAAVAAGQAGGSGPPARRAIVSASPEPFLALDAAGRVRTDPVKGTRPRGRTRGRGPGPRGRPPCIREGPRREHDDRRRAAQRPRPRLPAGQRPRPAPLAPGADARQCQHLVSTVTGRLDAGRDAFDLLVAAFPGGSITGAPKIRAMELIESLEPVRRGPYCGAALWARRRRRRWARRSSSGRSWPTAAA